MKPTNAVLIVFVILLILKVKGTGTWKAMWDTAFKQ